MTEFVFGPYRLEVDAEATRRWYDTCGDETGGCDCAYCRNFAAAAKALPPEVEAFLEPLGLSLRRPGEIGEYGPRPGGRWYMPMWAHRGPSAGGGGGRAVHRPRRHRRVCSGYGALFPGLSGALLPVLALHDPALGAGGAAGLRQSDHQAKTLDRRTSHE